MFPLSGIVVVIIAFYLFSSIKILSEYERGVIFRLGRLLADPKGPGLILVFAPLDRMVRVDLRQVAFDVPPQDVITRDNVTLKVNAVVFLRVIDPRRAVVEVTNYQYQTQQFALTTLRSVLGEVELDELLAHRDKINLRLQSILDQHTAPWGVKVANVEVKQVDLAESMMRAMAKQAEAEREKRSKIIHAEGEFSAAQRLVDAAHLLQTEPASIQLRYLQTLTEIGVEKNTTVIFPVPIDLLAGIQRLTGKAPISSPRPATPRPRSRHNWRRLVCGSRKQWLTSRIHDTEITLGMGKLLGLFFGLVILCGISLGSRLLARTQFCPAGRRGGGSRGSRVQLRPPPTSLEPRRWPRPRRRIAPLATTAHRRQPPRPTPAT